MTEKYETPEDIVEWTQDGIHKRYQDTAMIIFKEQQMKNDTMNYVTIGSSRRTIEYSNYGNQPVIVRRPTALVTQQDSEDIITKNLLKLYKKPRDNCTIS
ncbi:hypothetical protein HCN44_005456 [Aphidius gifuensis]|uniref:Uncharacterized protein n=1 Tax=Aphidius gifuensis TaxID=684658 RepID=A0A834Y4S5_APHGI|nr:putative uncharacterized protein BRD3OS [Aphidius gifuensis]XP_044010677.1 putative uncharacterized protein BRD3OS [Aphidius gifuensis]XP_044010686.1 putative uncharacterized protein BRD3OS [Aphidius gifuensis]KAF7997179.1 hypothetical protein HCN44_005456 [Aphidius gifuensis]